MTPKHIMNDIKQSSLTAKNTNGQHSSGRNTCEDCIDGYQHFEHMEQLYRVPCRTCNVKSIKEDNHEEDIQ